jgi:hypothetical protein
MKHLILITLLLAPFTVTAGELMDCQPQRAETTFQVQQFTEQRKLDEVLVTHIFISALSNPEYDWFQAIRDHYKTAQLSPAKYYYMEGDEPQ